MKYLISLLGFGLLVVLVASLSESTLRDSLLGDLASIGTNDLQKNVSCLLLCDFCDCDGSFVGDECICDCVKEGDKHLQCLQELKKVEQNIEFEELQVPTEELIQTRFRRDTEDVGAAAAGAGLRGNKRKNKRKKFNRRGRGRRFLQKLTSGDKKDN